MTDSKREARQLFFDSRDEIFEECCHGPSSAARLADWINNKLKPSYDSLLKENQELKDQLAEKDRYLQNMARNHVSEITRLREALNGAAESLGNHNDGNAVQDIMKALARADGNEGV